MLFLIVSEPAPTRPADVAATRAGFWVWIERYRADGTVRLCLPRAGRGAVALVDVPTHELLHRLLTEWSNQVPARFDVYPLLEEGAARAMLEPPQGTA